MGIKVIPENSADGSGVKRSQIIALVNKYYSTMKKKMGTGDRNLDYEEDAKSAWFPKVTIDALFKENGYKENDGEDWGLRMYYGVHDPKIWGPTNPIPTDYENQQMLILVVTKYEDFRQHDQLEHDVNFVIVNGFKDDPGTGLNHGTLCPPLQCEGSEVPVP
jgi:hypothetical protein